MRQIYPAEREVSGASLAEAYAYPDSTRPWVRADMVASVDGAATLAGRSGGLSGAADREVFALLRFLADVILVGAGTARAEGYQPVRPYEGAQWAGLRAGRPATPPIAVVTAKIDLDLESPLLTTAPPDARTVIITTEAAPPERLAAAAATAEVIVAGETMVDPRAAIEGLTGLGHRRILTEGGPHLLSQLTEAGLMDELCLTLSPLLTGPGVGRIVEGGVGLALAPQPLALAHVLADEGFLLCRYVRAGSAA
ncbi:MAG TPA: pyrimidine reductase family protein [Streptosporangiaceae bacterium]|nr:pyrimidine reductase family protein [Streptosporangiaceae bacterium]